MAWPVVAAIAGAGISAIGGYQQRQSQQDAANDSADHAEEMWEFNWEETERHADYREYELDLAKLNAENLRTLTNKMALDTYNRELYIRDYNYKSQVEAYNASEGQYAQQLDYNAMGAQLAKEEQHLWMEDQQKLIQFQYEDIAMAKGRAKESFDITREDLTTQEISKRGEFAIKSLEGWVKGLDDKGKVRVLGQSGRTRQKNLQSVAMSSGMQQALLNDLVTKSDRAFNVKQQENYNTYVSARREAQLGRRKTASSWDSAVASNSIAQLKIEYDQYGADMAADNRRLSPPPAYEDLPPITKPYEMPETHFPDIFRSEKSPGPGGAPNLMAGAGLQAFGSFATGAAKAIASYTPNSPNYDPGGGGGGSYSNFDGMGGQNPFTPGGTSTWP